MSDQLDRLVRTATPKTDESFLGFVLRLTELNVYKATSWILDGAGLINRKEKEKSNHDVYKDRGSFVFSRSTDLSGLSQLTGVDSSKLDLLRYRQTDRIDSSTTHLICNLPVPKFMIRLRPAKVCPDCLRESNYVRALWDLAPVTACPVHKRMLIDECPNCKRKITWSRQHVSICRCGFDWTEIESVEVEETSLLVSRHIYKLCGISKKEIRNRASKKFPLLNLDLEHFLSSLFFIAGQYIGIGDIRGRYLAPSYNNLELQSLLVKAFLTFSDWPDRYFQFLDWYKEQDFSVYFKLKKKTGLYNEFGFFYVALYTKMKSTQFDFMRQGFEKYLEIRWDSGVLRRDSLISKKGVRSKKYVTLSDAMKLLNRNKQLINLLIKEGKLEAIIKESWKTKVYLIEIESLKSLKRRLDKALTLRGAAKLLGIGPQAVSRLVANDCLKAFSGPVSSEEHYRHWFFDQNSVEDLLKRIEEKIPARQGNSSQTSVNFYKALNSLCIISFKVENFVKSIIDGEIYPCGRNSDIGLPGFTFERKHISDFLQRQLQNEKTGFLTIEEAAKELGVVPHVVSFLVKKGLIQTIESRCKYIDRLINIEEIKAFNSYYSFITELTARALNTSSRNISDLLMEMNIWPICGPNVDGGPMCVYRKSDLDSVDLASIVSTSKSNPRSKDRKTGLISVTVVAESLGIDQQSVYELVASGKLKAYTPQIADDDRNPKMYFTRHDVNDYKRRLMDGRDLVTTDEAARILNQSRSWFHKKWVLTGRLKVIKLPDDPMQRQYFVRTDVENLIPFKGKTVGLGEASELLDVSRSILLSWEGMGKLRRVSGPKIDGAKSILYLRSDIEKLNRKGLRQ